MSEIEIGLLNRIIVTENSILGELQRLRLQVAAMQQPVAPPPPPPQPEPPKELPPVNQVLCSCGIPAKFSPKYSGYFCGKPWAQKDSQCKFFKKIFQDPS